MIQNRKLPVSKISYRITVQKQPQFLHGLKPECENIAEVTAVLHLQELQVGKRTDVHSLSRAQHFQHIPPRPSRGCQAVRLPPPARSSAPRSLSQRVPPAQLVHSCVARGLLRDGKKTERLGLGSSELLRAPRGSAPPSSPGPAGRPVKGRARRPGAAPPLRGLAPVAALSGVMAAGTLLSFGCEGKATENLFYFI